MVDDVSLSFLCNVLWAANSPPPPQLTHKTKPGGPVVHTFFQIKLLQWTKYMASDLVGIDIYVSFFPLAKQHISVLLPKIRKFGKKKVHWKYTALKILMKVYWK